MSLTSPPSPRLLAQRVDPFSEMSSISEDSILPVESQRATTDVAEDSILPAESRRATTDVSPTAATHPWIKYLFGWLRLYGQLTVVVAALQFGNSLDLLSMLVLFGACVASFETYADMLPRIVSRPIDAKLAWCQLDFQVSGAHIATKPLECRTICQVPLLFFCLFYDVAWSPSWTMLHCWLQLPWLVIRGLLLAGILVGLVASALYRSCEDGPVFFITLIRNSRVTVMGDEELETYFAVTDALLPYFDIRDGSLGRFVSLANQQLRERVERRAAARRQRAALVRVWPTHPFEPSDIDDAENLCGICRDAVLAQEEVLPMHCGHETFHAHCLRPWLEQQDTCPVCRSTVQPSYAGATPLLPAIIALSPTTDESSRTDDQNEPDLDQVIWRYV